MTHPKKTYTREEMVKQLLIEAGRFTDTHDLYKQAAEMIQGQSPVPSGRGEEWEVCYNSGDYEIRVKAGRLLFAIPAHYPDVKELALQIASDHRRVARLVEALKNVDGILNDAVISSTKKVAASRELVVAVLNESEERKC